MRKIITLIRAHGLLNRAHGLLNRAHGLLSRAHGLARLNNYFPHGTAGAPYISYPNGWLFWTGILEMPRTNQLLLKLHRLYAYQRTHVSH